MYIPGAFAVEDRTVLYDFLDRFGFATLVSVVDGAPFATHLPMLLDREGGRLLGHVARANPHWHGLDGEREALVIFHGPHAYVSPTWYAAALAVPTWNYAAVHVYGRPRPVTDAEQTEAILRRMVSKYEGGRERPWGYDLPEDYRRKMVQAVVGIEMPIGRIEGKFKLNQNRPAEDRRNVVEQLRAGDAEERALAEFMAAALGL
jgi:transcriptional regulator